MTASFLPSSPLISCVSHLFIFLPLSSNLSLCCSSFSRINTEHRFTGGFTIIICPPPLSLSLPLFLSVFLRGLSPSEPPPSPPALLPTPLRLQTVPGVLEEEAEDFLQGFKAWSTRAHSRQPNLQTGGDGRGRRRGTWPDKENIHFPPFTSKNVKLRLIRIRLMRHLLSVTVAGWSFFSLFKKKKNVARGTIAIPDPLL